MKTKNVPFADIEAYEKKGWLTTNRWSIKDSYVVMVKHEPNDTQKDTL